MSTAENKSIEECMKRLDEIGELMSNPKITLEDSFRLYNEGIGLVKECQKQLKGIEKQIKILEEQEIEDAL